LIDKTTLYTFTCDKCRHQSSTVSISETNIKKAKAYLVDHHEWKILGKGSEEIHLCKACKVRSTMYFLPKTLRVHLMVAMSECEDSSSLDDFIKRVGDVEARPKICAVCFYLKEFSFALNGDRIGAIKDRVESLVSNQPYREDTLTIFVIRLNEKKGVYEDISDVLKYFFVKD